MAYCTSLQSGPTHVLNITVEYCSASCILRSCAKDQHVPGSPNQNPRWICCFPSLTSECNHTQIPSRSLLSLLTIVTLIMPSVLIISCLDDCNDRGNLPIGRVIPLESMLSTVTRHKYLKYKPYPFTPLLRMLVVFS